MPDRSDDRKKALLRSNEKPETLHGFPVFRSAYTEKVGPIHRIIG